MFEMQPIRHEINILGFHTIYYFEFGKFFSHPPERHHFWEMVYVDKGKIVAVTDGIGCILEQGQAIFHEPDEIHAHVSNQENANNMLVITFTCDSECMDFFKKKTFTLDKTSKKLLSLFMEEARSALGRLPNDYNDKTDLDFLEDKFGTTQLMQCHLTELLVKLIRSGDVQSDQYHASSESRSIADNSIVTLAMDYLEQNLYANLKLTDLCDNFFIGKSKLTMLFREHTGKTPMQYYADRKIEEAKRLLREENHSVSEITDLLCYSSIHVFSRTFKRVTGFSPKEYQKSIL